MAAHEATILDRLPPLVVPPTVRPYSAYEDNVPVLDDVRRALNRLSSSDPLPVATFRDLVVQAHEGLPIGEGTTRRLRLFVRAYAELIDRFGCKVSKGAAERMGHEWYWLRHEIEEEMPLAGVGHPLSSAVPAVATLQVHLHDDRDQKKQR